MSTPPVNSCNSSAGLIEKYINSAYDNVKYVADNLSWIEDLYNFLIQYGLTTNIAVKAPVQIVSTSPITLSGNQLISWHAHSGDYSVMATTGMRVLVLGQTDKTENGIYDVQANGWTRSVDFTGSAAAADGTLVFSAQGDAWQVRSPTFKVEVGTTPITFDDIDLLAKEAVSIATQKAMEAAASENAAKTSEMNSKDSELAVEAARDQVQQIINDAGEQSTLVALAQPDGDKAIGIQQELSGSVQRTQHDKNGETLSILDFGAKANDSSFDNQYKIQAAIDAANSKYLITGSMQSVYIPPGTFWVGARAITNTGESTQGGLISVQMRSGVRLYGSGTLKVLPNQYGSGAYFRAIGSDRGARISDVILDGFEIDGNKDNQVASTQCSNIVLDVVNNITVERVRSVEANGNGMMVRGRYPDHASNIRISNCYVYRCNFIGIQSSQFNGLVITGNTVDTTGDNCIDVYGDTGVSKGESNGVNFSITGNTVRNSSMAGIFPETVANGVVSGNSVYNCNKGIHVNRIYCVPKNITLSGNSIYGTTGGGIIIYGDMQSINITGNTISDWAAGSPAIKLGNSGGNVSGVYIHGNTFNPTAEGSYVLTIQGLLASRLECRNNFIRNNIGLTMEFVYNNTATTSTGVIVDSWAFASGPVDSTGLQMYRSVTIAPTVFGSTNAGTASYTTQSGKFMRIGELVYYTIAVTYSGVTGTGTLRIGNLPWAPNDSMPQPSVIANCSNVTLTAGQNVWATPEANSINFRIKTSGSTAEPDYLRLINPAYLSGTIIVSGWYYL